jgi:hypothetical protein
MELKPAHEVMVEKIKQRCAELPAIEAQIAEGGLKLHGYFISPMELEFGRCQYIGGLCDLLDMLAEMVIPENALGGVIEELQQLTYRHCVIYRECCRL